jgi:serine/threonine protein phosphatase PrpC
MSNNRSNLRAIAATTYTHKGVRASQEDYVMVDREKGIFVVADGFGGPTPGAEAAKISCESVRTFLFKEAGDLDATLPFVLRQYFSLAGNVLFNSLIYSNRKVMSLNKGKNVHEKGGASVLAAFIDGDLLAIANVGLCTARLLRNGKSRELVIPRSFSRMCDPFESKLQETGEVPLIAMGMTEDLEPEIFEYRLQRNDWLVLCTDGLPLEVFSPIEELQRKRLSAEQSVIEFTRVMNQSMFKDNVAASLMIF